MQNSLTDEENAKVIRSMIEHENVLFNQRIGWLMQIQGLLFAALSFAWDKKDIQLLVNVFSILGVSVSLASLSNIWVYFQATKNLKESWKNLRSTDYIGPDVVGFNAKYQQNYLFLPMYSLPFIFMILWLFILFANLTR
jgi:hypothetical protein